MRPADDLPARGDQGAPEEPRKARWLVLTSALAPYMLRLWEALAAPPHGQKVRVLSSARKESSSHGHEHIAFDSPWLEVLRIDNEANRYASLPEILRYDPDIVVACGHARASNLALPWAIKRLRPQTKLYYLGDSNVLDLIEDAAASPARSLALSLKRKAIASTFRESLSLGWTNRLAHQSLGIAHSLDIPCCALDFDRLDASRATTRLPQTLLDALAKLRRPRFLCPARLVPQKNHHALLEAFRLARASDPDFRASLCLIGDGPEREPLLVQGASWSAEEFQSLGAVEASMMGALYAHFDALVLPSKVEPWGIVATEALALGIPVVASEKVGSAQSLATLVGEAVLLTRPDVEGLASALIQMWKELETRKAVARARAEQVRARFDVVQVAARLAALAAPP